MTLLVDPPLLFASGYALGRRSKDERAAATGAVAVSAAVLAVSVSLYCDAPVVRPLGQKLGASTRRDFILNSLVLRFDPERSSTSRRLVVAALFASYPLWSALGVVAGRRHRNREEGKPDGYEAAQDDRPGHDVVDRGADRHPADVRPGGLRSG